MRTPIIKSKMVKGKMVKKLKATLTAVALALPVMLFLQSPVSAAGGGFALETPNIDTGNQRSLQRGAKAYVNYCMGCHTADYQRYSRMASDLGLDEQDVVDNLIFTTDKAGEIDKVGSLMKNSMSSDYGRQAFGVVPPNLALTARSRGEDWIYTYLKTFYRDDSRGGVGVNNLVYPGEGTEKHFVGFKQVTEGTLSPKEYDALITDITAFLSYMADPIKQTRHRVGMWVMLFLSLLTVIAYFLKKEYWKDVV